MSKKQMFSQQQKNLRGIEGTRVYLYVSPQRSEEEMSKSVFKEQAKDITVPVEVTVRNGRCCDHWCRYHHLSHNLCFLTITFVQDRTSISSLSQSSLPPVLKLSQDCPGPRAIHWIRTRSLLRPGFPRHFRLKTSMRINRRWQTHLLI